MASFRYTAVSDSGERVAGTIEGSERSIAVSRLAEQGLHPIEVRESATHSVPGGLFGLAPARVNRQELTAFTRQLAWLLQAGTTLSRSLEILAREAFSKALSEILSGLRAEIRKGRSFHDALAAAQVFPPFYLCMVEVGEATGTLASALDRLATTREREQKVRSKVVSALTYPLLLVVLSMGIVIFLMVSVVPNIRDMILSSGAPVPDSAQAVIAVSDWLIVNGYAAAAALAALLIVMALLWSRTRLPLILRGLALRLPVLGKLLLKSEVARFCRLLGALSTAGVSLPASLRLVGAMQTNSRIRSVTEEMETALRRGEDFLAPLERSGVFPPLLARMLKVGSETGNLAPSLHRATDILEEELDALVERSLTLLGPLIILGLSLFVGFIIVSLMGAVISINDLAV